MSSKSIFGASNIDSSASRGSQVIREIKMWRRDFDKAKGEIIKALNKGGQSESPYAPDRKTIDQDKVHGSVTEKSWKKVEISSGRDRWVVHNDSIKKLDVI